jgi:hypothetical protein
VTVQECWDQIAECTRAENWAGVEAGAMILTRLGDARAADGLMWAVAKGYHPHLFGPPVAGGQPRVRFVLRSPRDATIAEWSGKAFEGSRLADCPLEEIVRGWEWLVKVRAQWLDHLAAPDPNNRKQWKNG